MTIPKSGITIRDDYITIRFEKGEIMYDIMLAIYNKYMSKCLKTIMKGILIKFVISRGDFEGDVILDKIKQSR